MKVPFDNTFVIQDILKDETVKNIRQPYLCLHQV